MKKMTVWTLAALALAWTVAGCKPKAAPEAAAPAETVAAEAAPVAEAPAPVELSLPPVAEETAPAAAPAPEAPALSAEEAAVVVAKVNGTDITAGEIQKVIGMFRKQMGPRVPPEQFEAALPRLRERIVEELVMRQIMLPEVAKQGISLSDSEFAEIKAELAAELPPGTSLETYMAESGTTEAEMREQMAVRKMVMAKAEAVAKPTDEEIQKFYDENKEGFSQGETVAASHILIKVDPADDDAAKAAKRARLEDLRKQVLEGADFAELAGALRAGSQQRHGEAVGMVLALGVAADLGADDAGRIAVVLRPAHPADAAFREQFDVEGAARRAVVRAGGVADAKLGGHARIRRERGR